MRVDQISEATGFKRDTTVYDVTNLATGRKTTFRSAAKFRGGHVTVSGYRQALETACAAAGVVPHFYPLQIRHSFLTAARALCGLDGAQAAGGHKHADTTAIYAAVSRDLARKVAREMGGG